MADDKKMEITSGPEQLRLAQAASNLVMYAQQRGLGLDEAICIVAAVCADYGRVTYGPGYIDNLCEVMQVQKTAPPPDAHFHRKGPLDG